MNIMKVKNISNYPKTVEGVRIEKGEVEEIEVSDDQLEKFRAGNNFEVQQNTSKSKSEKNKESKGE